MQLRKPLLRKLGLFVLLSAVDLLLTWRLLGQPNAVVYEINPLARWSLEHLGWPGLIGFKTAFVTLAAAAALLVARSKPRAAGHVLSFGCAAAALVVGYSMFLGWSASRSPDAQLLEAETQH